MPKKALNSTYLRTRDLTGKLGVHRSTIWRWVRQGIFPSPISLTSEIRVWRESDVDQWISDRQAAGK